MATVIEYFPLGERSSDRALDNCLFFLSQEADMTKIQAIMSISCETCVREENHAKPLI